MDEFDSIERLFRPLSIGAPEAFGLMDDAAALPSRPGYDLIVTMDTLVEGVHFLPFDPPGTVARKLLRVNLSDLAAKGAAPYGYLLSTAWPPGWDEVRRAKFAQGLAEDQAAHGLKLFGGDTVFTPGPLTLSVTMMGWVRSGGMIRRSGAKPGDLLLVSGTIGDGMLGLSAARGDLAHLGGATAAFLAERYRLPQPRLNLASALVKFASAAADVSDGLLADAGHIARASSLGVEIDLEKLPLSNAAEIWLRTQPDRTQALGALATGGDDYEVICTTAAQNEGAMIAEASRAGLALTVVGRATPTPGVRAVAAGESIELGRLGWRHA